LTCRITSLSEVADGTGLSVDNGCFGRRLIRPDYRSNPPPHRSLCSPSSTGTFLFSFSWGGVREGHRRKLARESLR
jgi:hypothetical protein